MGHASASLASFGEDSPVARLVALGHAQPDAPALLAPGCAALTFGALARRLEALRVRLKGWGFGRGDVVVWPNLDRRTAAAAQAMLPVATTLLPLSAAAGEAACTDLLRRIGAKAVALPRNADHPIAGIAERMGIARLTVVPESDAGAGAFDLEFEPGGTMPGPVRRLAPTLAFVSMTSGSTGRPKLVPVSHRHLMTMARTVGGRTALGPGDVSGHTQPLHLANGMRAALLVPLLNGAAVEVLAENDVGQLLDSIGRGSATYFTASFAFHRELLARIDDIRRVAPGRLRFVRVASGGLAPGEMDTLETAFGVPVITALASTEAGTIAHQHLPPSPRVRGSVGPLLDCEVRLVDDTGNVVAPGAVGEIEVRGPQVFDGYLDDDEPTAASFANGWFRMGDLGRFDAAGELHLVGRVKEQINRGGDKISPAEIDAMLRGLPGVVDAAAFAVPHPRLGEEVVAAAVLAPGALADEGALLARAREALGVNRAPRRLWFVTQLPRTEGGKLRRGELPAWVGYDPAAVWIEGTDAAATPMSPLEATLAALWAGVLGQPAVSASADFFLLGGDSLGGTRLLGRVRAALGVDLPLRALFGDARTVAGMARCIEAQRSARGKA